MKPNTIIVLLVSSFLILLFQYSFVLPDILLIKNNTFEKWYGFMNHETAVFLGVLFKTFVLTIISIAILIYTNLRNKLSLIEFLLISAWYILISTLGVSYLVIITVGRSAEYAHRFGDFKPEVKIENEYMKEVDSAVDGYSYAGPSTFHIKYNYIAEVSLVNNTDKNYDLSVYKRIIFPHDDPLGYKRFNNYEYKGNPYEAFQEQKVSIKSGVNKFIVVVPIYIDYRIIDRDWRDADLQIIISSSIDSRYTKAPIIFQKEIALDSSLDNWEEIYLNQFYYQNCIHLPRDRFEVCDELYDELSSNGSGERIDAIFSEDDPAAMYSSPTTVYERPEGFRISYPSNSKIQKISEDKFSFDYSIKDSNTTVTFEILGRGSEEDIQELVPANSRSRITRINNRFRGYEYYFNNDQSDLTYIVVIVGNIVKISHEINSPLGISEPKDISLSLDYFKYLLGFIYEIEP